MTTLPTGTVTFLFTDMEGSTRLLQELGGEVYVGLLAEHHRIIRAALRSADGTEVKTEGDSFFAVFPRADDALRAAIAVQRDLAAADWPGGASVRVRMGLHTGEVALSGDEYVGLDIHRAARISAAAHGGQVLLSEATRSIVLDAAQAGVSMRDVGEHRLKDLDRPEHLYQLVIDGLPADFPPIRALSTRLDILPRETTSFIGREGELARAAGLLAGTRLLTLTGPGGTGKTRLALQLARQLAEEFRDGVAFVPLAPISDPDLVFPTVRQTLGMAEEPGRTAVETLVEGLRHRQALLLLDNFEQVLGAARRAAELMAGTEQLKIVVTSRSRLHVSGEQELGVPPLEIPRPEETDDLETISQSEAVALFMQRARAIRPDFELTAGNARAIVEICRRLDGLPLAIELAASRVKLLPPQALLARLERRLDILQSTSADRSDRQRTLRGAIDWSHELLSADEQALFRRLAIFVGGWTFEAAEAVVPAAGRPAIDVLSGLTALVDHSLVRQDQLAGEPRFSMLETIREYGREQLAACTEQQAVARAHGRHFAELVSQAESHLTSGPEWPTRLETEHDNVRAMLRWAMRADVQLGLVAAGALWRFWHLRGHLREGRALLTEMLTQPGASEPTPARAKALVGLAGLVYWMKDHAAAREAYEEALPIAEQTSQDLLQAEIFYSLGYVHAISQDWEASTGAYSQARSAYEGMGNELGAASSIMALGMVASLRGEQQDAIRLTTDALARFERMGEDFGKRNALSVLTRALMQAGRLAEARLHNRQTIEAAHEHGDPTALSAGLLDLASLDAIERVPERAARLVGAAQAVVERTGGEAPPQLINRIEPLPLLREQLDGQRLEILLSEGRSLTTDEAVELALAD